ncbi:MAG: alpha/beta hydrolase [Dehalococcoidia bacterium]|jgi:pimeloyl-ACP methyl ester carboxylesterase|nr:alpha/beta hydrolase [Dehalococcoidia bacterium]
MLNEKIFDAGGINLNYVETGDPGADPIVLLHGLSGRWQGWSQEIGLLSHRWHVFAFDARGHGRSDNVPDAHYGVDLQTIDAARFIEGMVGGPTAVVGHSMGALTSIGLAGTRPDLIQAAVLEDPPAYIASSLEETDFYPRFVAARDRMRTGISFEELVGELSTADPAASASAVRATAASHMAMDPEAWTTFIDNVGLERFDMDATLSAIECPVLLLQADPEIGAALLEDDEKRIQGLVSDCTHVRFAGVGHSVHRDDPINFRRVLFDFLDTI